MSTETTDAIRLGRRTDFFVKTPEWILVSGLSPQAQALYSMLLAHVNRSAEDHLSWPGLGLLAEMLGYRKQHSVIKYVRELKALGAINVDKEPCSSGRRNVYTVHETPPAGYGGHRSLNDLHDAWRAKKAAGREGIQQARRTQVGGGNAAPAALGSAAGAAENQTERTETKSEKSSPPARPHADARGRERTQADKRKLNREARRAWELPPRDDRSWLSLDNDDLAEDILDWADKKYICAEQARNMVEDMIFRPGYNPMRILNAALKVGRDNFEITDDEPLPTWLTEELPAEPVLVPAQSTDPATRRPA